MSSREFTGGIIILVIVAIILFIIQTQMDYEYVRLRSNLEKLDPPNIEVHNISKRSAPSRYSKNEKTDRSINLNLHIFDPNTVSRSEMDKMGFPKSLSTTIVNYRSKGGRFYKKEDIKKLYSFDPEWYDAYAPYISIKLEEAHTRNKLAQKPNSKYKRSGRKVRDPLNINTCTPEQLDQEWGVSPKVAQNIVKYREALGGFHTIHQVREVYTLADSVYEHNTNWYVEGPVKKININTADYETLNKNPYIRQAKIAKTLIAYRKNHGSFGSVHDLLHIKSISEEKLQKLLPYLSAD